MGGPLRCRRSAALETRGEVGYVGRVESDGGAEVDGAQLAALDQALDSARMDAKQLSRLLRREQRRQGAWLRQDTTSGDRRTRLSLLMTSAGASVSRIPLPQ